MNIRVAQLAAVLLAIPVGAAAQTEAAEGSALRLEEIVVTAQRRDSTLLDTPIAMTALSSDTIENIGAINLNDVLAHAPNVAFESIASGQTHIRIRGVSGLQINSATVGYYIDDIPVVSHQAQPDLTTFDIDRIEVLRGPQGTLYGEGAMGGALRVFTRRPDASAFSAGFETSVRSVTDGDVGYSADGMINVPLVEDRVAFRGVVNYLDQAGWVDAPSRFGGAASDVNNRDRVGGRLRFLANITDNLDLNVTYLKSDTETGGWSESDSDRNTIATHPTNFQMDDVELFSASLDYDFSFATLTATAGKYERNNIRTGDLASFLPIVNAFFGGFGLPAANTAAVDLGTIEDIKSYEARLVSTGEGGFHWVLGAFRKDSQVDDVTDNYSDNPAPGASVLASVARFDVEATSIYGEGTLDLSETWHITIGLRAYDEKRVDTSSINGLLLGAPPGSPSTDQSSSANFDETTWKASLSHDFDRGGLVWVTAATGFRPGGVNVYAPTVPGAPNTFDPDTITSYELGYKSQFSDSKVYWDVAAYYSDWENYQAVFDVALGFLPLYFNDPQGATIKGIETQAVFRPTDNLELSIGGSYNDTEQKSTGTRLALVPEFSGTASGLYRWPIGSTLSGSLFGSVARVGDKFNDGSGPATYSAYTKLDIRIGLEAESWGAFLFVQNATDEDIQQSFGPNEIIRGMPRSVGVTLRANF